jgi:hypothetical protein
MEREMSIPCSQVQALAPITSETNPVNLNPSNLFKIHSNSILFPTPSCGKWKLSYLSPHQKPICINFVPKGKETHQQIIRNKRKNVALKSIERGSRYRINTLTPELNPHAIWDRHASRH